MRMKLFYLLLVMVTWSSCVTFKQFDNRAKANRESEYEAAIIKKDGTIITGKELKHKMTNSNDPFLFNVTNRDNAITLDNKNYNDSDVVAFQNKRAFHKRYKNAFLIRLLKGKINLYYFDNISINKTYTYQTFGPTEVTKFKDRKSTFFFEKEKDKIVEIGIVPLRQALSDNPKALEKFKSYYPKDYYSKELDIEKLVSVFELYNQ